MKGAVVDRVVNVIEQSAHPVSRGIACDDIYGSIVSSQRRVEESSTRNRLADNLFRCKSVQNRLQYLTFADRLRHIFRWRAGLVVDDSNGSARVALNHIDRAGELKSVKDVNFLESVFDVQRAPLSRRPEKFTQPAAKIRSQALDLFRPDLMNRRRVILRFLLRDFLQGGFE